MPTARYAERIRMAMKTSQNPTGQPVSIKQLSELTGYSYEHCRKVFNAEPVGSRPFNDILCQVLGLDPDEMWLLAQRDKITFRLGTGFLTQLPADKRLVEMWPRLSEEDQMRVIKIVEGLVHAKEAELEVNTLAPKPIKTFHKKPKTPVDPTQHLG